ncbi:hypothetical protein ACJX0J_041463, partial [Zea mays]
KLKVPYMTTHCILLDFHYLNHAHAHGFGLARILKGIEFRHVLFIGDLPALCITEIPLRLCTMTLNTGR